VDAEELLVENSGQGKVAKRLHTGVVKGFRVLVLAWKHRRKVRTIFQRELAKCGSNALSSLKVK
jgi:hypothetical protein